MAPKTRSLGPRPRLARRRKSGLLRRSAAHMTVRSLKQLFRSRLEIPSLSFCYLEFDTSRRILLTAWRLTLAGRHNVRL